MIEEKQKIGYIDKELFLTFFKIGATTFGGGYAMISILKEEIINKKKWLGDDELIEVIAIAESTPGPIAINMATYTGYKMGGVLGSTLSTLGVTLPSLVIIYLISLFFDQFMTNQFILKAFMGIKCAVAFLILNAGINMLISMKKSKYAVIMFTLITITMFMIEMYSLNISTIYFIVIGAILGILLNKSKRIKI